MIKNLVDNRPSLFRCGSPVVGSKLILVFLKRVFLFFIVIGDLSSAPDREANFGLGGREATLRHEQLASAFLFAGNILAGANISV